MPLRWQSKPRFDVPRPVSGRLPAIYGHPLEIREGPLVRSNES